MQEDNYFLKKNYFSAQCTKKDGFADSAVTDSLWEVRNNFGEELIFNLILEG